MTENLENMYAVSMHTNNFGKTRRFYKDGLGLEETEHDEDAGWANYEVPGGSHLAIHTWDSGCKQAGGREPGTVTGIIMTVTDAEAFAGEVKQAGGKITDPVDEMPWGSRGGTAADPDGNEFVFTEPM